MNCTNCGNRTWLKFNSSGINQGQFIWCCSDYPKCKNEFLYEPPIDRFNFANNDFTLIISSLEELEFNEKIKIKTEIKAQMIEILKHFIECTWGAHYDTLFDKIIKPYLDNPYVLDYVLKSETVGNVGLVGMTGAKIYPDLMTYLRRVDSEKIQKYLDNEFRNITI